MGKIKKTIINPLINENPITLQILGICSALAVTSKLETAFVMSLAVIFVTSFSNLAVSIIRNYIPSSIRIIIQMKLNVKYLSAHRYSTANGKNGR